MGTPDFAVSTLNALIAEKYDIIAAFTRPDKPRGRGKKVTFSPVKSVALEHNIPVFQPTTLKTQEATDIIKELNADCIIVAAYGMLLPKAILTLPKYGCINVHASLLPKYRGAAPINRCIMDGEKESGVTIMQMEEGLDTGDMLLWEKVTVDDNMTATELHDILAKLGGELIVKVLKNVENIQPVKQDDSKSTYAAMLKKDECCIDFSRSAKEVCDFIRGLADYPCAYTHYGEKRIKVYRAVRIENAAETTNAGILMACGDGELISLTEVQPEGGKRMKTTEFLKGYKT